MSIKGHAHKYASDFIDKVIESHGGKEKCFVHPDTMNVVETHYLAGAQKVMYDINEIMNLFGETDEAAQEISDYLMRNRDDDTI